MQFASGGEMPLAILGAAAGAAHDLGQAFDTGQLSLTSLASATATGLAISAAAADQNTVHITNQGALTIVTAASLCGYMKSSLMQYFDTGIESFANIVY